MRASITGASEASFSGDALHNKPSKDAGKGLKARNDVASKAFQSGHDSSGWDRKARWQRACNLARTKMGVTGMNESVDKWGSGGKTADEGGGGSAGPGRRGSIGGVGGGGPALLGGPPGTIVELRTPSALKEHLKRGRGSRETGITLVTLEAGLEGPPEEDAAALVAQFDQRRQMLGASPLNGGNRVALSPADRVLKAWTNNGSGGAAALSNANNGTSSGGGGGVGASGGGSAPRGAGGGGGGSCDSSPGPSTPKTHGHALATVAAPVGWRGGGAAPVAGGGGAVPVNTHRFSDAGSTSGGGGATATPAAAAAGSGVAISGAAFPAVRRSSVVSASIVARPTSAYPEQTPLLRVSVDTAAAAFVASTTANALVPVGSGGGGAEESAAGGGGGSGGLPTPAAALRRPLSRQSSGALLPLGFTQEQQQHVVPPLGGAADGGGGGTADGGGGGGGGGGTADGGTAAAATAAPLRPSLAQQRPISAGRRPLVAGAHTQQPPQPSSQQPQPAPVPLLAAVRSTSPERRKSGSGGGASAAAAPPGAAPPPSPLPQCGPLHPASPPLQLPPPRPPPQLPPPPPPLQLPPTGNRSPPRSTDRTANTPGDGCGGADSDLRRLLSPASDGAPTPIVLPSTSSPTATTAASPGSSMPWMPAPPPGAISHDAAGGPRRPRPRSSVAGDGSPSPGGPSISQTLPVFQHAWAGAPPSPPPAPPSSPQRGGVVGPGAPPPASTSASSSGAPPPASSSSSASSSASELVPPSHHLPQSVSVPPATSLFTPAVPMSPTTRLMYGGGGGPATAWPTAAPGYRRATASSPGSATSSGAPPTHLYGSPTSTFAGPQPPSSPPTYRIPHAPPAPPAAVTSTGATAPSSPASPTMPAYRRASITGALVLGAAGGGGASILGCRSAANSPSGKFPSSQTVAAASGIQLRLPVGSAIAAVAAARISSSGGVPGENGGGTAAEAVAASPPFPIGRHSDIGLGGMKAAPMYIQPPSPSGGGGGSGLRTPNSDSVHSIFRTPNSDSVLADLRLVATEVEAELTREAEVAAAVRQAQSQALRSRIRLSDNGKMRHVGMAGDPWRKW